MCKAHYSDDQGLVTDSTAFGTVKDLCSYIRALGLRVEEKSSIIEKSPSF